MDVKTWLEGTSVTVAENIHMKSPGFPYITFSDDVTAGYHDLTTKMLTHDLTIDLRAEAIDSTSEAAIETLLSPLDDRYIKRRTWSNDDNCFVTTYTASIEELED